MDQWSTQLFMGSNWLAVLPHSDFGDVLDHGHTNRTLETCRNIITGYQASKKKQREATPLFQYTMTFTYPKAKGTDETTHIFKTTANTQHVHVGTWITCIYTQTVQCICSVLINGSDIWDDFGHSPDQKGRLLSHKRVRVCTQKLMLAFPQHNIVSCKGGSTVFHGNWLLPIPLAFTQGIGSWEWKWPKWAAE